LWRDGEIFDKEGDRVGIVEDGDTKTIEMRKSATLQIAMMNKIR
jgi:hypothetical protein